MGSDKIYLEFSKMKKLLKSTLLFITLFFNIGFASETTYQYFCPKTEDINRDNFGGYSAKTFYNSFEVNWYGYMTKSSTDAYVESFEGVHLENCRDALCIVRCGYYTNKESVYLNLWFTSHYAMKYEAESMSNSEIWNSNLCQESIDKCVYYLHDSSRWSK